MKIENDHMESTDHYQARKQFETYTKEEVIDRYLKKGKSLASAVYWGIIIAFVVGLLLGATL